MKIGYVSEVDPFNDRRAWSGTIFKIREGIERAGHDVEWIRQRPIGKFERIARYICNKFIIGGGDSSRFPFAVRMRAKRVETALIDGCDALFFAGGAEIAKYLPSDKPVIFYTDATFKQMVGFYWDFKNKYALRMAEQTELWAHDVSALILKSSKWAADSSINDYHQDPRKVYVLEFGANIDDKDIAPVEGYRGEGELNVLFSGVEWTRKGAAIAIETVRQLNERGRKARLYLCGIRAEAIPEEYRNLEFVEYVGFLNKNNVDEYTRYTEIIRQCHIFLLPTLAECSAIVFCEMSGYGLPIFTYNTGGTSNYVVNGVNGYAMPLGNGADVFATRIMECIENGELECLSHGGRNLYEEKLNWGAWARRFGEIVKEMGW